MKSLIVLIFVQLCRAESSEIKLNTGFKIPSIGLGTYGLKDISTVVDAALTAGYRLFDTAHLYRNEKELGLAFEEHLPKHNLARSDIFITTKILPSTEQKTVADFEKLINESLSNLRTDYIDLYLIHWPGVVGATRNSPEEQIIRHTAWDAYAKAQKQGLIKSIGVSNFNISHLEALKLHSKIIPALNQVEWHPKKHDDDLHAYCKEKNILLQAYSSLGSSKSSTLRDDPTIVKIAQKLNKSASQVLLRWATQNDIAIIPKASSKKHLDENLDLKFEIPVKDVETLNKLK